MVLFDSDLGKIIPGFWAEYDFSGQPGKFWIFSVEFSVLLKLSTALTVQKSKPIKLKFKNKTV